MESHHHCVITGPGRAGTTFLVGLLTRLGVNTGFSDTDAIVQNCAHAGLEHTRITPAKPYLIKSPYWCDLLERALEDDPSLVIDCVLLPFRDPEAAAESRAAAQERESGSRRGSGVKGGLWLTDDPAQQQFVHQQQLSSLVACLARYDIPLVLLWYPRLTQDPDYVFRKLQFLIPETPIADFKRVFFEVVRPAWVHQFTSKDTAQSAPVGRVAVRPAPNNQGKRLPGP